MTLSRETGLPSAPFGFAMRVTLMDFHMLYVSYNELQPTSDQSPALLSREMLEEAET